jgi:hypothetical protein
MFIDINKYVTPAPCDNCRKEFNTLLDIFTGKRSIELCHECCKELKRIIEKLL